MRRTKVAILIAALCAPLGCSQEDDLSVGSDTETSQNALSWDSSGILPKDANGVWSESVCFVDGNGPIYWNADPSNPTNLKCVAVDWNGLKAVMADCDQYSADQYWTLASTDAINYTIMAQGMCLGTPAGSLGIQTPVGMYSCVPGEPTQQWQPRPGPNSTAYLFQPVSNLCLDLWLADPSDGKQLEIYSCNQTAAQTWGLPNAPVLPEQQRQLRDAITNSWPAVTPLVTQYWGPCSTCPEQTRVTKIQNKSGWGCGGASASGQAPTRLINMCLDPPSLTPNFSNRKIIVHEFGHALGFLHEGGRPDNKPNTQYPNGPYCQTFQGGSWDSEGHPSPGATYGVFDPESVDNYCSSNRVWIGTPPQQTDQSWMLSRNDILGSQSKYGTRSYRRALWSSGTARSTNHKPTSGKDTLSVGAQWTSVDRVIALKLQSDGQLAVIRTDLPSAKTAGYLTAFAPLWLSGKTVANPVAYFGSDGILQVYDTKAKKIGWQSTTTSYTGATLSIQNDGNVVITDTKKVIRWQTNTAHRSELDGAVGLIPGATLAAGNSLFTASGVSELRMQTDGNLILYDQTSKSNKVLWASNTQGHSPLPKTAKMMLDGRLALLDAGNNVVWTAPYTGAPATFLALQEDGSLVTYEPAKFMVWRGGGTTPTHGQAGDFQYTYPSAPVMLWNGSSLQPGQTLTTKAGSAKLAMQNDGNLVLYVNHGSPTSPNWFAVWSSLYDSNASVGGDFARLTGDRDSGGNILPAGGALQVLSPSTGAVHYDSQTSFFGNTYLSFDDAGYIYVYRVVTVGADSIGFTY